MTRGPVGRRYWSALTGLGNRPTAERNWRGQSFWHRYLASFFVLPQPPNTGTVTAPQRIRSPKLFRYQSAVLAGAAVLVVAVVSVGGSGGGAPSNGTPNPGVGATPPESSTPTTSPSPSTSTTPSASDTLSRARGWHGTLRVDSKGEHVTNGPAPGAGQVFGLGVTSNAVLNGMGNLAQWSQDGDPTKAGCFSLLQGHAVYDLAVQVGGQLCLQALDGGIATAKVTSDGQDAYNGFYVDLDVTIYPS